MDLCLVRGAVLCVAVPGRNGSGSSVCSDVHVSPPILLKVCHILHVKKMIKK